MLAFLLLSPSFAADFNGDGQPDIAVGSPYESFGDIAYAGAVSLLMSGEWGFCRADGAGTCSENQFLHQDTAGSPDAAERLDRFGSSIAAGDFDGDGDDDLAVGAPYEDLAVGLSQEVEAGMVTVYEGSTSGVLPATAQRVDQGWAGSAWDVSEGSRFGWGMASGDFDADGYADLAVGTPDFEEVGQLRAGRVDVLYGSSAGLTSAGAQIFSGDTLSSAGLQAQAEARLGYAVAVGRFNADEYDDLAVAVPLADSAGGSEILVFYGSAWGLQSLNHTRLQDLLHLDDVQSSYLGDALAAGDLDGDGIDELIVGAPSYDLDNNSTGGAFFVVPGRTTGLVESAAEHYSFDSMGISGGSGAGERLGESLHVGDFDGDGYGDLAVGAPGRGVGGQVLVMHGSGTGLTVSSAHTLDLDTDFSAGSWAYGGEALTGADYDGDGFEELIVGVPDESNGTGFFGVYAGSATGLQAGTTWRQSDLRTTESDSLSERYEHFSMRLH